MAPHAFIDTLPEAKLAVYSEDGSSAHGFPVSLIGAHTRAGFVVEMGRALNPAWKVCENELRMGKRNHHSHTVHKYKFKRLGCIKACQLQ